MQPAAQQEIVLDLARFVIRYYLRWKPIEVKRYMTADVLKKIKLYKLIQDYVRFPPEYSKSDIDMTYLAYLLYPSKFKLNIEEQCINMFQRVYNGEITRFPTNWMSCGEGIRRFAIIFRYVMLQFDRFQNIEEMYACFASFEGTKMLRKYKIYSFALTLYDTPLDAMHYSLPEDLRSDFLYQFHKFKKSKPKKEDADA
jgi:hypothetical protein